MLERWRERDVFRESMRRREGAEPFVFYEGPPTANAPPAAHHVLARVFKDIFPRYQTMRGRLVERKGGWDCHGLPVEIAVEQKLGFKHKADIEAYGIAEFNAKCRESVFEYLEEWNGLTERIGYWVDLDDAYRTLDPSYVESVWWALKTMCDRDLLYEGHKVVPYCARCGTALSSHEVVRGLQGRRGPVASTSSSRSRGPPARCARATRCSSGRRRPGRSSPTPPSRSTPSCTYVRTTRRLRAGRGARRRACSARTRRSPTASPARDCSAPATSRRSRSSRRRSTARRATPCCPATSSPPRTAPASSTPRSRSARTTSGSAPSRA